MFIYKTTNMVNGKIYIGKTKNNPKNYIGGGVYLRLAIKKYGKNNFKKEILESNIETQEFLNTREQFWISFYNSTDPNIGYNRSKGGDGFSGERTEEEKLKISINHACVSGSMNPWFGMHPSKESRAEMSKSRTGYLNGKFGKNLSEETLEKMSLSKLYKKSKKSSSNYIGVCFCKKENRWRAYFQLSRKKVIKIGTFETEIEAALAYNETAQEFLGWKAILNNISIEEIENNWKKVFPVRYNSKLTIENVAEIKKLLKEGILSLKDISEKFSCSAKIIKRIKDGITWKGIGEENEE